MTRSVSSSFQHHDITLLWYSGVQPKYIKQIFTKINYKRPDFLWQKLLKSFRWLAKKSGPLQSFSKYLHFKNIFKVFLRDWYRFFNRDRALESILHCWPIYPTTSIDTRMCSSMFNRLFDWDCPITWENGPEMDVPVTRSLTCTEVHFCFRWRPRGAQKQ